MARPMAPAALVASLLLAAHQAAAVSLRQAQDPTQIDLRARDLDNTWKQPFTLDMNMTGPLESPGNTRHIQLMYMDLPHGMSDRIQTFTAMMRLGHFHNASVHIFAGWNASDLWLTPQHSYDIARNWSRYLDITANGGNPFHMLRNFGDCKQVHLSDDLSKIFDDGGLCANIMFKVWDVPRKPGQVPHLQASSVVLQETERAKEFYKMPHEYGSIHIRRCDRLQMNKKCTEPARIRKNIEDFPNVTTWVIFHYAEEGYTGKLKGILKNMTGHTFLFEEDMVLNTAFPDDNYFTYMVGKIIEGGASRIVETHGCMYSGNARAIHGPTNGLVLRQATEAGGARSSAVSLGVSRGGEEEAEAEIRADESQEYADAPTCNSDERGAVLNPSWVPNVLWSGRARGRPARDEPEP
mmetsp:Transcript_72250/g.205148  ORF Transcript_72250/g.205148 Transcript_72250/m.205148 type:complete len:409 (+) Transcript_72250:101-1327(+)